MSSSPRGAGGGMSAIFQNAAQLLSIGIFFSLIVNGLSTILSRTRETGMMQNCVPTSVAAQVGALPPVSILFAAFLCYNPIRNLLGRDALARLPTADQAVVTGHGFFPSLIAAPFRAGLAEVFGFAAVVCLIAAVSSWTRGGRFVHDGR